MKKIKVKITQFGENERTFHFNVEISQSKFQDFWRPLDESSDEYLKIVGKPGSALIRAAIQMDGVARVYIRPYELQIRKGEAFEWEDIEAKIIEVLTKIFSERGDEIEINPLEEK